MLNLLKPGEPLFITEGSSDCWAMLSAGHKAIAIPSATLLTREDIELLKHLGDSPSVIRSAAHSGDSPRYTFHMFPDRDAPGERLFLQLQKVLPTLQHHQLPPDCSTTSCHPTARTSATTTSHISASHPNRPSLPGISLIQNRRSLVIERPRNGEKKMIFVVK